MGNETKLTKYANQMGALALHRANALREIEAMLSFDGMTASHMRAAITEIIGRCNTAIDAARTGAQS